jgi:hypothetical protein
LREGDGTRFKSYRITNIPKKQILRKNLELLWLSLVPHTEQGDAMNNQTIKQIGNKMRECIPLREDMPQQIVKALRRLSEAESRCVCSSKIKIIEN